MTTHKPDCAWVTAMRETPRRLAACSCGGEQAARIHEEAQRRIRAGLKAVNKSMKQTTNRAQVGAQSNL